MIMKTTAPSRPAVQRRAVACSAGPRDASRRPIVLGLGAIFPAIASFPAVAMILEEDDEELVEKAKANRKNRLEKGKEITRTFMQDEGLKNKTVEGSLSPLQTAVNKLSKSGAQLDSGDVSGAKSTLSETWVADFVKASKQVGGDSATLLSSLDELKASASSGDLAASKKAYVGLVAELQSWTASTGIAGKLSGL